MIVKARWKWTRGSPRYDSSAIGPRVSLPSLCSGVFGGADGEAHLDKNRVPRWRGRPGRSRVAAAMCRCRGSMSSSPFQLAGVGQVWYPQVFIVVPSVVVPYVSTSFHWGRTESMRGQVPLQSIPPLPFPPPRRPRWRKNRRLPFPREPVSVFDDAYSHSMQHN